MNIFKYNLVAKCKFSIRLGNTGKDRKSIKKNKKGEGFKEEK